MAALSFNLFLLSCFTTFALLCFTTTALTTTPTITKPRRYVTKLIHPGSVHSPFYNPTATVSDRARRVIDSSSARLAYLQAKFQEISLATGTGTDDVRAGVIAETKAEVFVANISIGEPPSPQLLVIDTGSSLSWTQCQPCSSCFQQALPVKGVMHQVIAPSNQTYADGRTVTGPLATETLTFVTSDEGTISVPNIAFGCANSVGDGAKVEGLSTPLEILGGLYFLTLQSISVGETNLNISPNVFQRPPNRLGGVVIDSGTTLTYLPRAAFDPLNVEVRRLADGLLPGLGGSSTSAPCYTGGY
uniref:Peptidase A1 domain-containing protein n=1 Tax=Fagus sylvatica TaxID=28930 RepID=A0A2N9GGE4_FAGSY